ncbi:MAG: hypothetical protein POELPBGB_02510 [Bacteroidia bacterium]|nr:hypothetical protein [Bacteroidia bacterium]
MNVLFKPEAEEALFEISKWVEEKEGSGSGIKFAEAFIDRITEFVLPDFKYAGCFNDSLAVLNLRCIAIKDWVVAFKQTKDEFIVHYILYGPGLK